jgi:beta-lactamase superfamily II metal-dependent hydrolase
LIPKNNKEYKIFINNLKDKNTNLVVVNSTKTINLLNGKVEFIPNFVNILDDEIRFFDDNSILVKITYKNFKIILSNDISFRYLKNFLDKSFFIIQIPRHGKYKEDFELIKEFLSKNPEVKVKFGIISTDFSNFYKLKFSVFSTENFGDIEINFKNKHLKINKIVRKSNGIVIEI